MYYTVYRVMNKIDGKQYIGVHKTDNLEDDYMGSGKLIKRAQKKYGIENFKKEILFVYDNKEDMFLKEAELVDYDYVCRDDTYNLKVGGSGGFDHINNDNDYHRMISSKGTAESNARRIQCPEFRAKISKKCSDRMKLEYKDGRVKALDWAGRKHREDTKKKIGEANSMKQKGESNSQYGTCWVYSLSEKRSLKISKDMLDSYIDLGWSKGRKINFD